MTAIATKDLTGAALDWAVATAEIAGGFLTVDAYDYSRPLLQMDPGWFASEIGVSVFGPGDGYWRPSKCAPGGRYQQRGGAIGAFRPSSHWQWAGPIIERVKIDLIAPKLDWPEWRALRDDGQGAKAARESHGETALIAAMRAYVAHCLGETVDIPKVLA